MRDTIRHSLRRMRRNPVTSIAAVCTLALSLGAATAVFAVADAVLIRPLPLDEPDRVVVIWPRERANPDSVGEISHAVFRTWQQEARSFDSMAAIGSVNWTKVLREGEATTVPVAAVSASFFPLLGASPLLGRTLIPADDQRGSPLVTVMSHRTWRTRFRSDPAIVGRPLRFREGVYTVVGVMPEGFDYPRGADFWVAVVPELAASDAQGNVNTLEDRYWGVLFVVGRLRPGVSNEAARAEVNAFIAREPQGSFRPNAEAVLTPLLDHIFGATRPALFALTICVALVVLIGCANVAVLLLIRTEATATETATRLAIGASRSHVVGQSLADSTTLAVAGGIAGCALAYWAIAALTAIAPADVPRLDAARLDARGVLFAALLCVVAVLAVGFGPGIQASRWTISEMAGGRLTRSSRLRPILVVAQVSLTLVLLVCAGLVGRSFANLLRIDVGFDPANVLTLNASVPDVPLPRSQAFYAALLERVRAMPGVQAAGAIYLRPLELRGIGIDGSIVIEGQRLDPQFMEWERNPAVNLEAVTPGYFEAIGARIVRGRTFRDDDDARAPLVTIISERLAARLWPDQDPIGKRIYSPGSIGTGLEQPEQRPSSVIGVVEDGRYRGLTDPRFDLYLPYLQSDLEVKHLMVRTAGDPVALAGAIRAEAVRLEPGVLVENVTTMQALVDAATRPWRFSSSTLWLLGVLAVILASVGLYAAISQSVVQRTREIGVRVAIGAVPAQVARLVAGEGLRLTAIGVVAGLAVGTAVARALAGLLYGVSASDPITLAAAGLAFLAFGAAALLIPAWRAARMNPVTALRRI